MAEDKEKGRSVEDLLGNKPQAEGASSPPADPNDLDNPDASQSEVRVKKDESYGTVSNIATGRPGENPAPPPGDAAKDAGPDVNYDAGRPVRPGEVKTGMVENKPAGALSKDDISPEMKATMPKPGEKRSEREQLARQKEREARALRDK